MLPETSDAPALGKIDFDRIGIPAERIQPLNPHPPRPGRHVLYWMEASPRIRCNHALAAGIALANAADVPLLVVYALPPGTAAHNPRQMRFLLDALPGLADALRKRGIGWWLTPEAATEAVPRLARDAVLVLTDRGYLRHPVEERERVARALACPLWQVETNVVVPVETLSDKEEYAARTIRPKMNRLLTRFLIPLTLPRPRVRMETLPQVDVKRVDPARDPEEAFSGVWAEVPPRAADGLQGGEAAAWTRFRAFLKTGLAAYDTARNNPTLDGSSRLGAYLRAGQIAPLEMALAIHDAGTDTSPSGAAFLEQLLVRRELAVNFVYYNAAYDRFASLPTWCQRELRDHTADPRPYPYDRATLEAGTTHDPAWNAAQRQMRQTGFMPGYMRMYWGKKVLEWSATPEEAFDTLVHLNDAYELDGRDPNGYAGVAWCFGKHDRPWAPRPVFGTIRYMNDKGLRRKFDVDAYIRRWADT